MNWIKLSLLFVLFSLNIFAQDADTLLLTSENIYFDFGKDDIRSEEMNKLNQLVERVQEDITGFIQLTGHTDSIGTDADNNGLSKRRANQVIEYLVGKRIAPKMRFYTGYKGEYIPVADNGSEEGRQMNRRVEIEVFEVKTSEIVEKVIEPVLEEIEEVVIEEPSTNVKFEIRDEETNKLIQSQILHRQYITADYVTLHTKPAGIGELALDLEKDTKLYFEFYSEGYFHNSEEILIKKGEETLLEIKLKAVKKGNKLALKNLYFYGNQAKLLPESVPELRRLKNSLLMNPNAIVEIGGHINYPNTHPDDVPLWSVKLSKSRSEVIYKYLVDSGIDAKRLSHKGYSNTQMINPKATKEVDMAPNRRVEIKVMGYLEE